MKSILTFVLLTISLIMVGQNNFQKEILEIINNECKGSTSSSIYYDTVNCKFIDNNTLQYTLQSYERATGRISQRNVFTINFKNIDLDNIIPNRYKERFFINFYTKDNKKTIKQQYFPTGSTPNTMLQEYFQMGDFASSEYTEKLTNLIIKYVKTLK